MVDWLVNVGQSLCKQSTYGSISNSGVRRCGCPFSHICQSGYSGPVCRDMSVCVCVLMFVAHEMPLYATQFQYTLTGSGSVR